MFATAARVVAVALDGAGRAGGGATSLAARRERRAYPGAPPFVPHAVSLEEQRTQACNTCHVRGGWAPALAAYAPLTPHPEYRNCLQCHVVPRVTTLFAPSDWQAAPWPRTGLAALPGSPPAIPHELHLRGNCLACHAGPAAAPEIRTSHPFRANCRQCHVPQAAIEEFSRPLDGLAGGRAQ